MGLPGYFNTSYDWKITRLLKNSEEVLPLKLARRSLVLSVLAAFVVFAWAGLFWDDQSIISADGPIAQFSTLAKVFTGRCVLYSHSADSTGHYPYYRPLVDASFVLEYAIAHERPFVYHLTNLLVHLANVLVCFELLRRLIPGSSAIPAAWIGSAFFGLHPVQCESVLWPSARPAMMSLLFLQLCLYLTLAATDSKRLGPVQWFGMVLLYIAALLSKEITVVGPAVALILWLAKDVSRSPQMALIHLTLLALTFAYLLANPAARASVAAVPLISSVGSFSWHLVTAIGFYCSHLVMPIKLMPAYSLAAFDQTWTGLFGCVILCAFGGIAAWCFWIRSIPALLVLAGLAFFVAGPALPLAAGLVFLGDHYLYQALWGLALSAAVVIGYLRDSGRLDRSRLVMSGMVMIAGLAALTLRQSAFWLSEHAMWNRVIELDSSNVYGGYYMANYWENSGDLNKAIQVLEPVVAAETGFEFRLKYAAALKLGKLLFYQGRYEESLRAFTRAATSPDFRLQAHVGQAVVEHCRGNDILAGDVLTEAAGIQNLESSTCLDLARLALRCRHDPTTARRWYELALKKGSAVQVEFTHILKPL